MKSLAILVVLTLGLTLNLSAQEGATDTTIVETEVATGDAGVVDSGEAASLGANSTNPEKEEKELGFTQKLKQTNAVENPIQN